MTRNPLYLSNALMWSGFLLWTGLLWLAPPALLFFVAQYSLLVHWEESQLVERFGECYMAYQRGTPRWLPRIRDLPRAWRQRPRHAWPEVAFSERGTLLTLGVLSFLLLLKYR